MAGLLSCKKRALRPCTARVSPLHSPSSAMSLAHNMSEGRLQRSKNRVPAGVEWTVASWLEGEDVMKPLAKTLVQQKSASETELTFIQRLGRSAVDAQAGQAQLLKLLEEGEVLSALAAAIWGSIERLLGEASDASDEDDSDAGGANLGGAYGPKGFFFTGLEGRSERSFSGSGSGGGGGGGGGSLRSHGGSLLGGSRTSSPSKGKTKRTAKKGREPKSDHASGDGDGLDEDAEPSRTELTKADVIEVLEFAFVKPEPKGRRNPASWLGSGSKKAADPIPAPASNSAPASNPPAAASPSPSSKEESTMELASAQVTDEMAALACGTSTEGPQQEEQLDTARKAAREEAAGEVAKLKDSSWQVRRAALGALSKLGADALVPHLKAILASLDDPHVGVQKAAVNMLDEIDRFTLNQLQPGLAARVSGLKVSLRHRRA